MSTASCSKCRCRKAAEEGVHGALDRLARDPLEIVERGGRLRWDAMEYHAHVGLRQAVGGAAEGCGRDGQLQM